MKIFSFLILLFCIVQSFAQMGGAKRQRVNLNYGEHGNTINLKAFFNKDAREAIIQQVGKDAFNTIIQPITEAELPACYKTSSGNQLTVFTMYMVAKYTTMEYDEFGYNQQQTTYAIVEVPLNENKDIEGDCVMKKTFYIRIPVAKLYSVIPKTAVAANSETVKKITEPHSLLSMGKINVPCDKFTSGIYNGEQINNQPDGYGMYLFADSSFYCGSFLNGKVNGNGVLYNTGLEKAYIGNWANGKLTGDFYEVSCNGYRVDINTVYGSEYVNRAGMWINEDVNRIATSNILQAFAKEKKGIYNNFTSNGTVDIMYTSFTNERTFFKSKTADFYSDGRESEIFDGSVHKTYSPVTDKQSFETDLSYAVPTFLYPPSTITLDDNFKYFGKTSLNKAEGYGNFVSRSGLNRLFTSMFSNAKSYGFKMDVYNDKNKFFYAGNFDLTTNAHTGTYAKFNYANPKSVSIYIGSFTGDNETLDKGISIELSAANKAITFKYSRDRVGKGYIMFPMQNVIYRGELVDVAAEGAGEVLENGAVSKMNYKAGRPAGSIDNFPQWVTPVFTNIFNTPFELVDKLQ